MAGYAFAPDYRCYITRATGETYRLETLLSCQAQLTTTNTLGQLQATFADPGHAVSKIRGSIAGQKDQIVAPHAMQAIQLLLKNRYQQWAVAWTGYIDEVHQGFEASVGDTVTIKATSPAKLWERTRLTPSIAQSLGYTVFAGVSGSTLLQWSAQSVGYPLPSLVIDPAADSGSKSFSVNPSMLANDPQNQTWMAVMQGVLADTGLEWFFTETGLSVWRPLGYLRPQLAPPRPIDEEDLLQSTLSEGDTGIVTRVEVRWGALQSHLNSPGIWTAPAAMEKHLGVRTVVFYAPWIGANGAPNGALAANYLAQALGQMYAANVLTGTVTLPADPAFQIGRQCQVAAPGAIATTSRNQSPYTTYYISSVVYDLQWNGPWTMTLGLTYGRAPGNAFPYASQFSYPVATADARSGLSLGNSVLLVSADNPQQLTTGFTVQTNSSVPVGSVACDPSIIYPGSVITIRNSAGTMLGNSPKHDYTAVATPAVTGPVLLVNQGSGTGYVTFITYGNAPDGTTQNPAVAAPSSGSFLLSPTGPYQPTNWSIPIGGDTLSGILQDFGAGPGIIAGEPNMFKATGNPLYPNAPFHTGIDFAAANGSPVLATVGGKVKSVGWDNTGYGYLLIVSNGNLDVYYAHLDSNQWTASAGQSVTQGMVIAYSDTSGFATGPHLHFGVFANIGDATGGHYVDPKQFFAAGS